MKQAFPAAVLNHVAGRREFVTTSKLVLYYFLIFCADNRNDIAESNEDNYYRKEVDIIKTGFSVTRGPLTPFRPP